MTTPSPHIKPPQKVPYWRDVRILAMFGQAIFMAAVLLGIGWLINNFIVNAEIQGLEIGFDFLDSTAGFDIAEGISYSATDTFGRALWVGTINTIRVSVLGIILTTMLGILVGIARLSNNWLVSQVASIYIEIVRNIPLLVMLYFIYFGVVIQLPAVRDSVQPLGLPIYLNQRGIAYPSLTPTIGFPILLAFIVLGIIGGLLLWTILSRQEELTGRATNKVMPVVATFLIVVGSGWFVTSRFVTDQAILTPKLLNITELKDFETVYLARIAVDQLKETGLSAEQLKQLDSISSINGLQRTLEANLQAAENNGDTEQAAIISEQLSILNSTQITVCGLENGVGSINAASQLRQLGIPVRVNEAKTISKAAQDYADGNCDMLVGVQGQVAAERAILENASAHSVIPVLVPPMVPNVPAPAGFNIQGGSKISPEFAALLAGLVLYTGAFVAEIVRAGILSISKGQSEAARALGLSDFQRLRLIILPQAMRVIIPPMTNQYLNLTKNSSLAVAIAYPDLVSVGNTVLNQSGYAVQVIIIFMVTYLSLSLTISAFLNWYNKKVALVER